MTEKQFTLFWRTGDRQVIEGTDIVDAMNWVGIGNGALPALDFYASGDCSHYAWDAEEEVWKATPDHPQYAALTPTPPQG